MPYYELAGHGASVHTATCVYQFANDARCQPCGKPVERMVLPERTAASYILTRPHMGLINSALSLHAIAAITLLCWSYHYGLRCWALHCWTGLRV